MTESLILLHIAQTVPPPVSTVDPALVFAAVVAFSLAASAIWLPLSPFSPSVLRHRRGRRQLASGAVTLVVFLALLPSVIPYDHLLNSSAHVDGPDESIHAAHCHISPGTCSDAPVSSGPGQLLLSAPLVVTPAMLAVLIAATATVLIGISFRPEIRPPLRLCA
jgi:hypothetical protein